MPFAGARSSTFVYARSAERGRTRPTVPGSHPQTTKLDTAPRRRPVARSVSRFPPQRTKRRHDRPAAPRRGSTLAQIGREPARMPMATRVIAAGRPNGRRATDDVERHVILVTIPLQYVGTWPTLWRCLWGPRAKGEGMAGNDVGQSAPEAPGPQESLLVRWALKATLDRELAEVASTPSTKRGGADTPEHTAGPGRCTPPATRADRSPRRITDGEPAPVAAARPADVGGQPTDFLARCPARGRT